MGKVLDPARQQAYAQDGVLFPLAVLTPAEVAAAHDCVKRIEALDQPLRSQLLRHKSHLASRTLFDIVCKPAILDAVEDIIGPDILAWGAGFFNKPAGSTGYVSWHQDATYWGLEPPDIVTAWVALTPSTVESGCMRVVPGTHRNPVMAHRATYAEANMLSRGQEIAVDIDEADAVDVVLQPGEMSLHHVLIAHGSQPNRAAWPRIGFAIRYIGGHVRQTEGRRDSATLVRGRSRADTFDLESPPGGDLTPADLDHYHANAGPMP